MTFFSFIENGPLDMIMGTIVISNAAVMFAATSDRYIVIYMIELVIRILVLRRGLGDRLEELLLLLLRGQASSVLKSGTRDGCETAIYCDAVGEEMTDRVWMFECRAQSCPSMWKAKQDCVSLRQKSRKLAPVELAESKGHSDYTGVSINGLWQRKGGSKWDRSDLMERIWRCPVDLNWVQQDVNSPLHVNWLEKYIFKTTSFSA
ncbi:hypothetical protein AK812_SmicGene8734 [Symbiodinium microadriaticum]|uniref:Uncharacterized protein n=1 Tax=Symbiodinium microadriaticum TaxID=2951 RepID=A0A1Q9EK78_SYMMI|nr:hypothetical protein AK812_SmicGene8734 [Symbiodinium microadriaticum]